MMKKMTTPVNKYKCENHKLDFACLGCIRAWIERHDRMLEFIIWTSKTSCCNACECISCEATKVLREIGKKKD